MDPAVEMTVEKLHSTPSKAVVYVAGGASQVRVRCGTTLLCARAVCSSCRLDRRARILIHNLQPITWLLTKARAFTALSNTIAI